MAADLRLVRAEDVSDANPIAGDLLVDGVDFGLVDGDAAIVQEIEVRLRWWRAEWFLDRRQGVPYLERILRRGVSTTAVGAIIAREIRRVPGVRHVERVTVGHDRATRRATVAATIRLGSGARVEVEG